MGACQRALLLDASDTTLEARLRDVDQSGPEAAQRKIRTFNNQTLPAIQALETRGVLTKVDASGSADEVFAKLAAAYEQMQL